MVPAAVPIAIAAIAPIGSVPPSAIAARKLPPTRSRPVSSRASRDEETTSRGRPRPGRRRRPGRSTEARRWSVRRSPWRCRRRAGGPRARPGRAPAPDPGTTIACGSEERRDEQRRGPRDRQDVDDLPEPAEEPRERLDEGGGRRRVLGSGASAAVVAIATIDTSTGRGRSAAERAGHRPPTRRTGSASSPWRAADRSSETPRSSARTDPLIAFRHQTSPS